MRLLQPRQAFSQSGLLEAKDRDLYTLSYQGHKGGCSCLQYSQQKFLPIMKDANQRCFFCQLTKLFLTKCTQFNAVNGLPFIGVVQ